MTIMNSGTVYANKPFTAEALRMLDANKNFDHDLLECIDDDYLDIDEWYESCFEDELCAMVETLTPLGYVFNGKVAYYGDYDGQIIVKDNNVRCVDIEDVGLYNANDNTLISMLNERGYKVFKDGIEVCIYG